MNVFEFGYELAKSAELSPHAFAAIHAAGLWPTLALAGTYTHRDALPYDVRRYVSLRRKLRGVPLAALEGLGVGGALGAAAGSVAGGLTTGKPLMGAGIGAFLGGTHGLLAGILIKSYLNALRHARSTPEDTLAEWHAKNDKYMHRPAIARLSQLADAQLASSRKMVPLPGDKDEKSEKR